MTKKKTTKKDDNLGLEIFAATAAAAVAGAVFLYGTAAGKKSRTKVKSWTIKAKAEVLEKIEKAKELNEDVYHNVVDGVMEKYAKLKTVEEEEIKPLALEMKKHWKEIKKELTKGKKKTKKAVKATKKATKKAVKKVVAKKPTKKSTSKKS